MVIEAFSVPPELAQRGLTGEVVASKLLDELNAMQAATDSVRAPASYANTSTDNIRVQIPQTGVSIGDVRQMLVSWLGHQTHIRGEVYRTADGLTVAARSGSDAAVAHTGPDGELDRLIHAAAEDVYSRTQPYRYGAYRAQVGRLDESEAAYRQLAEAGPLSERPWGYIGLERTTEDPAERERMLKEALALNPNLSLAWANLAGLQVSRGHPEAALESRRRALAAINRRDHGGIRQSDVPAQKQGYENSIKVTIGDYAGALKGAQAGRNLQGGPTARLNILDARRQTLTNLHDIAAARALIPAGQDDVAFNRERVRIYRRCCTLPNALIYEILEDWASAYRELSAAERLLDEPDLSPLRPVRGTLNTVSWPRQARALAHMGQIAEAQTLIARTPLDCYVCVQIRGEIAALTGDAKTADHWFGEAVRMGPSVPFAETEWARALLARGDAAGAITKLTAASRKSPRYADALELWGEALLKQGDAKAAALKFAEADKYAPKWGRNHLMWGEALEKLGKTAEARSQYAVASRLEMSVADKARLAAHMGRAR